MEGVETTFLMFPDGSIRQWAGSVNSSPVIGTLDASYANDLTLLYDAPQPIDTNGVEVSIEGGVLSINPPSSFTGTFTVNVTASDQVVETIESFQVTVSNSPPILNPTTAVGWPSILLFVLCLVESLFTHVLEDYLPSETTEQLYSDTTYQSIPTSE